MTAEQMNGAEMVIKALGDQGVDVVFGYPGGAVLPIYDALFMQNRLRHILVRHEQGAVHAAEGYARSTGKVGVVLVTSGPGATNAVTGLTDALMDSVPVVCLTGQVPTHLIGNDAFQEADTTGITRPCTKHNYLVKNVERSGEDLARGLLCRAQRPSRTGGDRPAQGRALRDRRPIARPRRSSARKSYRPQTDPDPARIAAAVELIAKAKRPLIYAGGGIINSGPQAVKLFGELVDTTGFPCTQTLMGLGAFPGSDPQSLGMVGMHGTFEANHAMHDCDVMLCVGARFDDRVTGRLNAFSPNSTKIHIDIDPSSINKNVRVDVPVVGDCGLALEALILERWTATGAKLRTRRRWRRWWKQIETWRKRRTCLALCPHGRQDHQTAIRDRAALCADPASKDIYITTEVGQHQMWAAQLFKFEAPNRWMTSGGLGTMGYGLPAAMGVQIAHPDARGSSTICRRGLDPDEHPGRCRRSPNTGCR